VRSPPSVWSAFTIVMLFVLASACSPARDFNASTEGQMALADLSPASLGHELRLSQSVRGELAADGHTIRFELEVTTERLALVGLTTLGIPLFELVQDKDGITVHDLMATDNVEIFKPQYLLGDFKMAYWPLETINLTLGPMRMRAVEQVVNGKLVRLLLDNNGQSVLKITYPVGGLDIGELVVRRYDLPYRLRIRTINVRKGPET